MARRNYNYEKRQKDLARRKKQELKRQRKLERKAGQDPSADSAPQAVPGEVSAPPATTNASDAPGAPDPSAPVE